MKKIKELFSSAGFWAFLIIMVIIAAGYGISWLITCGLIKLITMCFGWSFSWAVATGIWICLCMFTHVLGGLNRGH